MKIAVAFSGGMDSATVLAKALAIGAEVYPVSFIYPSKHNQWERTAGMNFIDKMREKYPGKLSWCDDIDVSGVFKGFESNLIQRDKQVPEGHYEAENMKLTVVPGRNIIFASILAGYAWSRLKEGELWMGIHAGDHFIYPDCRPEFYHAMREAIWEGTDRMVDLVAPFLEVTKVEILKVGIELGVDYRLTRTCYKDQKIACGRCGSCQERLTAFKAVGIEDPLEYESRELLPK